MCAAQARVAANTKCVEGDPVALVPNSWSPFSCDLHRTDRPPDP